ncbi:tRNA lysidine(34) synthetase TilS [Trichocoleus sp. FACHB-591]|uniref:tRNA lysidine(34) synthetase TilS n=1 Tax=Trichocoleus sp. FACHB-591 TaxID=2692872 RepID=UPI001686069D|nr:tRNA lysidine(34) synthetase TilS [Trichocoleus sp. FACHB-591]MBD2094852.1 tRNA lysidine(34) synthetase TilS [Trichocoleus sp. FACHB-591]
MSAPSTWTPLHAKVHQTLRSRQLLPRQRRLLIAVSGGQDSLCLAKLLLDLQPKWNWQVAIAHCDHRWRTDSEANATHVQQLAQSWQVEFYQRTATQALPSEAAARTWRYQALTELAQAHDYHYLVTGHTASDRAETLLYNLMRGSGADGLQALTWQRALSPEIMLVRPLLNLTRPETAQFCQVFNLPVWEDSTNQDLKYARNRIRQELLPYLQQHFNPQVEKALAQATELLQADVEYLEQAATELHQQAQHPAQPGLNRLVLQPAPLALQRRVVRQFLQTALTSEINFEQIEKLASLISAPNRSQTDPFPGGAIAVVEGEWIWLKQL